MTKKQITSALFGGLIVLLAVVGFVGGALVHMAGTAPHSKDRLSEAETRMLAQTLVQPLPDGRYNVVSPQTITVPLWAHDPGMAYDARDFMVTAFHKQGVDAQALMDRLYKLNAKSVRLSITSSTRDGYVVDDGTYDRYFQFSGGGWDKLHREHPQAANMVHVSRPVYDEESGLFLVYVRVDARDSGRGSFMLYRNEDGAVKPVGMARLWVR